MATDTFWGSWVPNSSTNQRMRVSVEWNVTDPSPGATSVTVSVTARLHAGYSFNWNGALMNRWGTYIGSTITDQAFHAVVPTNGSMVIYTSSRSVSLGSTATSLSIGISVRNIGYVGPYTANVTGNIPIPAIPTHATPTNVVASWPSSDANDINLTWGGGTAHEFQYRVRGTYGSSTAAWSDWLPLSSVARSSPYVITHLQPGYERQFRVRRGTGAGASGWAVSNVLRQFLQPNTPYNVAIDQQADNRRVVSWSIDGAERPGPRPVERFDIVRHAVSSGAWGIVANVSGAARSWVDTTARPNDRVTYYVIAANAWNRMPSAQPWPFVRSTPAAPSDVVASRTGPAAALVEWISAARAATGYTVEASTSDDLGVSWSGWAELPGHVNFSPNATSRAITGMDASLWYRFRVVALAANDSPNTGLRAESAQTDVIRPAAKPNEPSLLAPSGVVSSADPVMFRWRHNPTDGSDQTQFELRHRPQGGSWTTEVGASTNVQQLGVELVTPGIFEAQVRTKGQHADWSDWSPVIAFEVLDPPTVEVTSPEADGVVPSNRVTATISYYDATSAAMAGWRAELADEHGVLIEQRSGTGPISTITFATHLTNFTDYQVTVWVTSGTSLESLPAVVEFSTDFLPPATPDMDAEWLEPQGLVRLAVTNHDGDGVATVETVSNRIERSTDLGQTWTVLLDNAPLDVGLDDDMVPLGSIVWYRAVAVGPLGTEAATDPPVELHTTSGRVWLTGENGATQSFHVNAQLDINESHESVSEQYYGRELPIAHYGEARPHVIGVAGTLTENEGYNSPLTSLLGQDVYYRDPLGNAFWASIRGGFSRRQTPGPLRQNVSFTVERVHRVAG